jgi:hypothetical protein
VAWPPEDTAPVRSAQYGLGDTDGLAQAVGENGQPRHAEVVEPLHHVRRQAGVYHRLFERIAVDQHGCRERLKALEADGGEDTRSHPAKVDLRCGHVPHNSLLRVGREVPPPVHNLDAEVAPREVTNPLDEVVDGRDLVQLAIRVRHPYCHRRPRTSGLIFMDATAAAARRSERRDRDEDKFREPPSTLHPVHSLTPSWQDPSHSTR